MWLDGALKATAKASPRKTVLPSNSTIYVGIGPVIRGAIEDLKFCRHALTPSSFQQPGSQASAP